ncbi:MAG: amino acid adenylation domain-containing protein [Bacteroidales bacterium]
MIDQIKQNIEKFPDGVAFVINETAYTYLQFGEKVSDIKRVVEQTSQQRNEIIGVVTYNDIETYATIYALWFSGKCFLPINPLLPVSRNQSIIDQTGISILLSSGDATAYIQSDKISHYISTSNIETQAFNLDFNGFSDDDLMYILFTSGSTGVPKGVPINRRNLNAFVSNFSSNGYSFNRNDRFLQMFDFTFDVSVLCYTVPLFVGASVHTVPLDNIKFLSIYQILDKHKITVAMVVPSVVAYLRPYFRKINLPHLNFSMFTGEALPDQLVSEWAACTPNAVIQNYYGPTEGTIDCLFHMWEAKTREAKTYNGIVSIGKPFGDTVAIIVSESGNLITDSSKGELWIGGNQIALGYYKLDEKTKDAFVSYEFDGGKRLFYRTGDLVYRDVDGDIMYCGRIDYQVQVQGYRVELGELEHYAKQIAGNVQVAAAAKENSQGNTLLYLFLENSSMEAKELAERLHKVLPFYMMPTKIINSDKFPITSSGKIDRKKLLETI